ncbi:hypothetical protein REPUB_Repub04eG0213500 [Reevesia pubescens]
MKENMDQTQRTVAATANSRTYQFHTARAAITDLFNLYLGRSSRQKADDSIRELALPFCLPFSLQFPLQKCQRVKRVKECLLFHQQVYQSGMLPSTNVIANTSNFQSVNPVSTLILFHVIGSPAQSTIEPSSAATLSPVKSSDITCNVQPSTTRMNSSISNLRQLCCKIILTGLECNLISVTQAEIFYHMLKWLVTWDQRQRENIPDDEALFTLILEIQRRRDMIAVHMQMLDQHLHCPTFGTHRILSQTTPNVSVEAAANLWYSPITYPSALGEPLHGEDLAASIQRGSLDWERALRCIRHAIRSTPSPDWWKRVLIVAPCY